MSIKVLKMAPGDIVTVDYNFATDSFWLLGDTVLTAGAITAVPTGLTFSSGVPSGAKVFTNVTASNVEQNYEVSFPITTTLGQTMTRPGTMVVTRKL